MIETVSRKLFGELAERILLGGAKKATKYLSPKLKVSAIRRGRLYSRCAYHSILFTIGVPNYEERIFVRLRQKAKLPFPVRQIQLKWPKEKRRSA